MRKILTTCMSVSGPPRLRGTIAEWGTGQGQIRDNYLELFVDVLTKPDTKELHKFLGEILDEKNTDTL